MVKRLLQTVILSLRAVPRHARRQRRIVENRRQIEAARFPVIHGWLDVEHVNATYHFIDPAESEIGHILPHLLSQKEKEIDYVLGLPLKLLTQQGILGGDADGAGIEVALAHHHAAHRDQWSCGKTE